MVGRDGGAPVEADRRREEERAARQRPMGRGSSARPVCRPRRHRHGRRERRAASDHQDDRGREQSAVGKARHCDHLRPRRQSLHRAGRRRGRQQLTDDAPKKADPRLTDSQKFIRDQEEELLDAVKEAEGAEEEGGREGQGRQAAGLELQDRQVGHRPDALARRHARLRRGRANARRARATTSCPARSTRRDIWKTFPARTAVGDTQNRALLAVLNLKTGKSVWADGSFAPPVGGACDRPAPPRASRRRRPSATSAGRCPTYPTTASSRWRARAPPTTRIAGTSPSTPRPARRGSSIRCMTTRGFAKRAAASDRRASTFLPDNHTRVVPLGARRLDAPLHARRQPTPRRRRSS